MRYRMGISVCLCMCVSLPVCVKRVQIIIFIWLSAAQLRGSPQGQMQMCHLQILFLIHVFFFIAKVSHKGDTHVCLRTHTRVPASVSVTNTQWCHWNVDMHIYYFHEKGITLFSVQFCVWSGLLFYLWEMKRCLIHICRTDPLCIHIHI